LDDRRHPVAEKIYQGSAPTTNRSTLGISAIPATGIEGTAESGQGDEPGARYAGYALELKIVTH